MRVELGNLLMTFRRIFKYGFSFRCGPLKLKVQDTFNGLLYVHKTQVVASATTGYYRPRHLLPLEWQCVILAKDSKRSDWKPRIWWILLTRGRRNVSKDTRFIVPPLWSIRLLVEYGRAHHPVISIPRDESLRDSSSLTWCGPSHL